MFEVFLSLQPTIANRVRNHLTMNGTSIKRKTSEATLKHDDLQLKLHMDNSQRDIYKLGAREKWWSKDLLSINIY